MPIVTDPLSLLFLASFLFGLLFLIVTTLLGSLGQGHGVGHSIHGVHGVHGVHSMTHQVHLGGHIGGSTHQMIQAHKTTVTRATSHHNASSAKGGSSLFSYINPTTVILFLLGFGFFGYVFHNLADWAFPLVLLGACVGGLVVTILLLSLLARFFGNAEGETVQDVSDRVGLIGKVSMTIQENGLGEILYTSPGGLRKSITARSTDGRRLERDQEVVVTNYQHGVAEVDTWEHFMEQEQVASAHSMTNTDPDVLEKLRVLLEESENTDEQMLMRKEAQKE